MNLEKLDKLLFYIALVIAIPSIIMFLTGCSAKEQYITTEVSIPVSPSIPDIVKEALDTRELTKLASEIPTKPEGSLERAKLLDKFMHLVQTKYLILREFIINLERTDNVSNIRE